MTGRGGGGYASGKNALAICQRCSDKIPYKELVYDGQYPDMRVCKDCWDPKHPQEYLPDTFDPITLYDSTGDPDRAQANLVTINPVGALHINPEDEAFPPIGGEDDPGLGGGSGYYDQVEMPLQLSITLNAQYYNFITGGGVAEEEEPAASVELLAKFEGSDGSTSYTEASSNAAVATFNGSAAIDTAESAFGSSSLELTGSFETDWVTFPDISAYDLNDGPWTIEGFVRFFTLPPLQTSAGPGYVLFDMRSGGNAILQYGIIRDSFGYRVRAVGTSFSEVGTIVGGISINTWYHWAITKEEGGEIRAYFNGNYETGDFGSAPDNLGGPDEAIIIGCRNGADAFHDGHLDNIRFTRAALYTGTGSYTVPTEDF